MSSSGCTFEEAKEKKQSGRSLETSHQGNSKSAAWDALATAHQLTSYLTTPDLVALARTSKELRRVLFPRGIDREIMSIDLGKSENIAKISRASIAHVSSCSRLRSVRIRLAVCYYGFCEEDQFPQNFPSALKHIQLHCDSVRELTITGGNPSDIRLLSETLPHLQGMLVSPWLCRLELTAARFEHRKSDLHLVPIL